MVANTPLALSIAAMVIATASLIAVAGQPQFRGERRARLAIDQGSVIKDDTGWTVHLLLTNVGKGHAHRVRVWLEDESETLVGEARSLNHYWREATPGTLPYG
jgi:hypothetical protein